MRAIAADQQLIVRRLVAIDFSRHSVEADVGDMVLAARIGAAADLDANLSGLFVCNRLHPVPEHVRQVARFRNPQIAGFCAGAADHVCNVMHASGIQSGGGQSFV